jgi:hypothetical protein
MENRGMLKNNVERIAYRNNILNTQYLVLFINLRISAFSGVHISLKGTQTELAISASAVEHLCSTISTDWVYGTPSLLFLLFLLPSG